MQLTFNGQALGVIQLITYSHSGVSDWYTGSCWKTDWVCTLHSAPNNMSIMLTLSIGVKKQGGLSLHPSDVFSPEPLNVFSKLLSYWPLHRYSRSWSWCSCGVTSPCHRGLRHSSAGWQCHQVLRVVCSGCNPGCIHCRPPRSDSHQ